MKAKALHYVRALGIYRNGLQIKRLQPMSNAEHLIHSWQNGLPANESMCRVDHLDVRNVASVHPWFTIVISIVQHMYVDQIVYDN